jgi:hypothetical protein
VGGFSRWDEIALTHEHLAQEHSAAAPSVCGSGVEIGGEIEASSVPPCVRGASHLESGSHPNVSSPAGVLK